VSADEHVAGTVDSHADGVSAAVVHVGQAPGAASVGRRLDHAIWPGTVRKPHLREDAAHATRLTRSEEPLLEGVGGGPMKRNKSLTPRADQAQRA